MFDFAFSATKNQHGENFLYCKFKETQERKSTNKRKINAYEKSRAWYNIKFDLKKFEFSALIFAVDFRFFPCYQNQPKRQKG